MIYVPGQAGADVSWGAGGLSAAADGEAEDSEKIGTALTLRGDTVHVNEVFAVKEGGEDAQAQDLGADPAGDGGQIADGIRAAMLVEGARQVEMSAADGWSASGSRSAVVYDRDGDCAGIMGYTLYVAPFQSGEGTLFYDCYCRSLFVPEGTGRCEEMVVALDSPLAAGQVIDTAEPLAIALGTGQWGMGPRRPR